jgi:hypothetical protein
MKVYLSLLKGTSTSLSCCFRIVFYTALVITRFDIYAFSAELQCIPLCGLQFLFRKLEQLLVVGRPKVLEIMFMMEICSYVMS